MKICAIICEYNPFHNGHLYQLERARQDSGADTILCLMSGNFTQRGESAIIEKHVRASHALRAGADIVLELPTLFATSNAELFAKGAVHILNAIPSVKYLSFGAENANASLFQHAANLLNNEPKEVSLRIKTLMQEGIGYAKARALAWQDLLPLDFLSSPNNILALEYVRALQALHSNIKILPIERKGSGYNDSQLKENFSSASAIRKSLANGVSPIGNVPDFTLNDLTTQNDCLLDLLEKHAILATNAENIAKVCDCTEGLENAFKKAAMQNESLVNTLTSPRYTSARIRRIALQNLLKINEKHIRESLSTPLYLRVLGIKKERNNEILSALSESNFPIIIRAHDEKNLTSIANDCFQFDQYAEKIYQLLNKNVTNEKNIFR